MNKDHWTTVHPHYGPFFSLSHDVSFILDVSRTIIIILKYEFDCQKIVCLFQLGKGIYSDSFDWYFERLVTFLQYNIEALIEQTTLS